jgi:hypothetical protein
MSPEQAERLKFPLWPRAVPIIVIVFGREVSVACDPWQVELS